MEIPVKLTTLDDISLDLKNVTYSLSQIVSDEGSYQVLKQGQSLPLEILKSTSLCIKIPAKSLIGPAEFEILYKKDPEPSEIQIVNSLQTDSSNPLKSKTKDEIPHFIDQENRKILARLKTTNDLSVSVFLD